MRPPVSLAPRAAAISGALLLLALLHAALPPTASAQMESEDNPIRCAPCTRDCRELGIDPGELICTNSPAAPHINPAQWQPQAPASRAPQGATSDPATPPPARPKATPPSPQDVDVLAARWDLNPVFTILEASPALWAQAIPDVLVTGSAELARCFAPETLQETKGGLRVDLWMDPEGIPVGVQGLNQGLRPRQARCMLQSAWDYRFTPGALPEAERHHLRYRVDFALRRYLVPFDEVRLTPGRPKVVVENLRPVSSPQTPYPTMPAELLSELGRQAQSLRQCHVLGLASRPDDVMIAEVDMILERRLQVLETRQAQITTYHLSGEGEPPQAQLRCLEEAMQSWRATIQPLPSQRLHVRFQVAFYPAGQSPGIVAP